MLDTKLCPTISDGAVVILQHVWNFPSTNTTFLTVCLASDNKVVNTFKGTEEDNLIEVFPLIKEK